MWSQQSRDHMYIFVEQHLIMFWLQTRFFFGRVGVRGDRVHVMMSVIQVKVLLVATLPREMVDETKVSEVAPHEQQVGFWLRF